MKPFTIIGYHESTGRTFGYHVEARDLWSAFKKASLLVKRVHGIDVASGFRFPIRALIELSPDAVLVACVPGHVEVQAPCGDSGSTCTVIDYLGES